ncbi:MAG: hypothetical protein ABEJ88_05570 [Halobacterium sp.]
MSADTTAVDAGTPAAHEPDDPSYLSATVVRYENGPDRCTVSPENPDSDRQLTAWLSVDADVVVALADAR